MPSPFPGMDPYLEDPAFWRDFHGRLIYAISEQLLDRLPGSYDAAVEERIRLIERVDEYAGTLVDEGREFIPDVTVTHRRGATSTKAAIAGSTAVLDPVVIETIVTEEVRERWVEIRHRPTESLVTVIEVLSPSNKTGDGYGAYQSKRDTIMSQYVSLVELDLLLGGQRVERSPRMPVADYYAIVNRSTERRKRFVYAWMMDRALPSIPIPLKAPDADVVLDLAAAFADAYERGRYARRLPYQHPPQAPIPQELRSWAESLTSSRPG